MKYLLIFFIALVYFLQNLGLIFAVASTEELKGKIDECMKEVNPRSITDYSCAKGDMLSTGLPLSDQWIAYMVVMSVRFKELDEAILKDMKILQQKRETEVLSWTTYITEKSALYREKYLNICTPLGGDLSVIQAWKKDLWQSATIDAFPQTVCNSLVPKKVEAWENMSYILASKGVAKGYQNAKDLHIDKVKGKYATLLEKWSSYQRILGNAVGKFTAYIKDPV